MLMLMMLILLVQMKVMTKWLSPRFKWLSTNGWGGGKEGGGYKGGWGGGEVDGQIQNWEQQRPNWEKMRNKPSLCLWGYLPHGYSPGGVKVFHQKFFHHYSNWPLSANVTRWDLWEAKQLRECSEGGLGEHQEGGKGDGGGRDEAGGEVYGGEDLTKF